MSVVCKWLSGWVSFVLNISRFYQRICAKVVNECYRCCICSFWSVGGMEGSFVKVMVAVKMESVMTEGWQCVELGDILLDY